MDRKKAASLALLSGVAFLLTACAPLSSTGAQDYLQMKSDVQEEADTAQAETEGGDAVGVPQSGVATDGQENSDAQDNESDYTDSAAVKEKKNALGDAIDSLLGGSTSEEWTSAMEVYRELLEGTYNEAYAADYDTYGSTVYNALFSDSFWVEDLNSDGIPELLLADPEGHTLFYTCNHGLADDMGYCLGGSTIWYYPGTGVFAVCNNGYENIYNYLGSLEDHNLGVSSFGIEIGYESILETNSLGIYRDWYGEQDWDVNRDDYDSAEDYEAARLPDCEKDISEERFQELLKGFVGDTERVELPPTTEWYDNTEENRSEYLK